VLRVKAKVDNRRDTLQLIVEECAAVEYTSEAAAEPERSTAIQPEMDIEDIEALEQAEELPEAAPVESVPPAQTVSEAAAPQYSGGGDTPRQPAAEKEEEQPVEQAPPPAPEPAPAIPTLEGPVKSIKARKRVSAPAQNEPSASEPAAPASGNGNGNGSGQHDKPGRNLHIRLPRTSDLKDDTRRMQHLDDLLRDHEGSDQITLYIPNGAGMVLMRPCYTVNASRELVTEVMGVLGEDSVELEG
jgi:DNA polymerase-3 subunit alpha